MNRINLKYSGMGLLLVLATLPAMLMQSGCANIIPPQGGLRDSLPPVLVKANPADSSLNFNGSKITLSFDEYVNIQGLQENLIVSPTPRNNPEVQYKLNTVTVRLKDSLEPNTTYIINFGSAIRDENESNVLKNFKYIYSTGNYFDSLTLKGKIRLAQTGQPDTTLILMLHKSGRDSAVVEEKPRYVTKPDGRGNFEFRNLPAGTFYLYALKDESGSRRYFNGQQLFAFADQPFNTAAKNDSITLYAWSDVKKTDNLRGLNFQNPGQRRGLAQSEDKRLRWHTNLLNFSQDLQEDLQLLFDQPLKKFDPNGISLFTDTSYNPVKGYKISTDSALTIATIHVSWAENTQYHLILNKEFGEDSTGKKLLKTDTLHFATRRREDYGQLSIRLRGIDTALHPVLQFVMNDEVKRAFPLNGPDFKQDLFVPGEYQLRILFDRNKNGVWDGGQFFGKHLQPEIVKPISRKITVKAGMENEFEIAVESL